MQFFDIVKIKASSGAGGDGCVAARREKYIPYGGPAGGNGGKGGSIIFLADAQLTTLAALHGHTYLRASAGESGKIKEQYGKDAEDVVVCVPVGTLIKDIDTGKVIHEMKFGGEQYVLLPGGKGGIGNMHFKNAVTQYSNFGLLGEPGHTKEFLCELQLLADVALLGVPSVGKTSLLNSVSAAAAKTADYPFTTLIPNLGVVTGAPTPFVMIDIPGLIEGAAGGKGLGNEFLRHVLKARIWCLVMDASRYELGIQELIQLCGEIHEYIQQYAFPEVSALKQHIVVIEKTLVREVRDTTRKEKLLHKELLLVMNKIDLVNDAQIINELKDALVVAFQGFGGKKLSKQVLGGSIFPVSAGSLAGISTWINHCSTILSKSLPAMTDQGDSTNEKPLPRGRSRKPKVQVKDITKEKLSWLIENAYLEPKDEKYVYVREVSHPDLTYLSYVIPRGNDEAELRYRRTLEKQKILTNLTQAGVKKGDVLFVRSPYAGKEDRWIRRE